MPKQTYQSGQVLLIVTLTMIVALTVGLAVVSRTITNLKISKQNEESQRALQAAEAGLEKAIKQSAGGNTSIVSGEFQSNQSNFSTKIEATGGNLIFLNGGNLIQQDVGFDVWLSTYPNYTAPLYTGSLLLYFGTNDQNQCIKGQAELTAPALEVLIISNSVTNPTVEKYFFDPCGNRRIDNNASDVLAGGDPGFGTNFRQSIQIPSISSGLIMKVIPLYNSAKIAVSASPAGGSSPLPTQGYLLTSTGSSGDTSRKIVYFNAYPQIPVEIFPNVLVAQ